MLIDSFPSTSFFLVFLIIDHPDGLQVEEYRNLLRLIQKPPYFEAPPPAPTTTPLLKVAKRSRVKSPMKKVLDVAKVAGRQETKRRKTKATKISTTVPPVPLI